MCENGGPSTTEIFQSVISLQLHSPKMLSRSSLECAGALTVEIKWLRNDQVMVDSRSFTRRLISTVW